MTGSLVQAIAAALLHSLWQGALVVIGYLGWARVLRRGSPGARGRAAATTIALLCGLPLIALIGLIAPRRWGGPAISLPLPGVRVAELATSLAPRWAVLVVAVWAAGAAILLARIAVGVVRTRQLHRGGRTVELPRLATLARAVGLARAPRVRVAACGAPCVVGWLRPALLVPDGLAERLSPDELDAIVLHELAHLRRRDTVHQLALRIAAGLAWHQLALRWLFARLGHERELCCDELAVRAGGGRHALAGALVALEERRHVPALWVAASTGGGLSDRVIRLLAPTPPSSRLRGAGAWLGGAAVMLLGVAAVAASAPATRYVIVARDPAGPFTVELAGERLVAATIAGRAVPPGHIRQDGRKVRVLAADGDVALVLDVTAPGEIRWDARPATEAP